MAILITRFDDDLSAGVTFLRQFADERIDSFFAFLRDNAALLFDREKQRLTTHVEGFAALG